MIDKVIPLEKLGKQGTIKVYTQTYVEELEKENAELQKLYHESDEDNNKLRENIPLLAEAKEIIKTFLGFAEAFGYSPSMDKFITEAEQFLSEVEK